MTAVTLQEKVLNYIQCSGAALEQAEKQASEKKSQEKQVDDLIPGVVESLLRNGRIEPHQKDAAVKLLRNPIKALEILGKTAEHRNDEETARLGSPVAPKTTKSASARGGVNSPYVGAKTTDIKDSDRILFERLGLTMTGN